MGLIRLIGTIRGKGPGFGQGVLLWQESEAGVGPGRVVGIQGGGGAGGTVSEEGTGRGALWCSSGWGSRYRDLWRERVGEYPVRGLGGGCDAGGGWSSGCGSGEGTGVVQVTEDPSAEASATRG